MREVGGVCKILVGRPERKRPLRISRHGRDDNIKIGPGEIGWEDVGWIHLVQNRVECWALWGVS
jgi:hypothetical protein